MSNGDLFCTSSPRSSQARMTAGRACGLGDGGVDGEEVVPVHAYAGHAVARRTGNDAVARILI